MRDIATYTKLEIDTAYHEAAHAVAHVVLDHELESVSRLPPQPDKLGGTHGRVLPKSLTDGSSNWSMRRFTPAEIAAIKDSITILLIGDIAEAKLNGGGREFDPNNLQTSDDAEIVGRMTALWRDHATADAEVAVLSRRARAVVDEHWGYIRGVAEALLERGTLSGMDVRALHTEPLVLRQDPSLTELLTTAEAHGELWALFVRHADGVVELHKTDTYKTCIEADDVEATRDELEDWLKLLRHDAVPCAEALIAEVELLRTCSVCERLHNTS